MSDTLWVAILSLLGTLIGSMSGILISNKLVMWRLEQLEKRVESHNSVVERTVMLERDIKTVFKSIENQKEMCQKLFGK